MPARRGPAPGPARAPAAGPPPAAGGPPPGRLGAWVKANPKVALGATAAAAALALGLRAKKKGTAAPATTTTAARTSAQGGGLPTYDSTASDVYNSIQPEIEALQSELTAALGAASNPHDALNPASTPAGASPGTSGPRPLAVSAQALTGPGYGAPVLDAHGTTIVPNTNPGAAPLPTYAGSNPNTSILDYLTPNGQTIGVDPAHESIIQGAPGSPVSSTFWWGS